MADNERDLLLVLLGQTIAKKPINSDVLGTVIARIKAELGEHTFLEAAATVAQGESNTKVTDITSKTPLPNAMFGILKRVIPVMKFFSS